MLNEPLPADHVNHKLAVTPPPAAALNPLDRLRRAQRSRTTPRPHADRPDLMLIVGLIFGAVAAVLPAAWSCGIRCRRKSRPAPPSERRARRFSASSVATTSDSNQAIVAAVKRVGPAVVTVVNTMPQQQVFGFFGDSVQQPKASGSGVMHFTAGLHRHQQSRRRWLSDPAK